MFSIAQALLAVCEDFLNSFHKLNSLKMQEAQPVGGRGRKRVVAE